MFEVPVAKGCLGRLPSGEGRLLLAGESLPQHAGSARPRVARDGIAKPGAGRLIDTEGIGQCLHPENGCGPGSASQTCRLGPRRWLACSARGG